MNKCVSLIFPIFWPILGEIRQNVISPLNDVKKACLAKMFGWEAEIF